MSLERKDLRGKADHDVHAAFKIICDHDEVDMGVYIEKLVVAEVRRRSHDAMMLADALRRAGITGNSREEPGMAGNHRESAAGSSRSRE